MARARNIKPGFYKNEDLAECSLAARLLAPGLWMLADKEGRLEDRPKRIKGEIFPYDNIEVETLLEELARVKHITRYNHGEQRFIQINKFTEHQRPHNNETKSVIPPYVEILPTMVESASVLTTDSLNPSSLNAEVSTEDKSSYDTARARKKKSKLILPIGLSKEDWRDFCQFRGSTFTHRAKQLILEKVEALRQSGNDPGAVLRQSIERGWKGVFELKEGQNGGNTRTNNGKINQHGGIHANGGFYHKPTERERHENSIIEGRARIAAKYGIDLGGEGREGIGDIRSVEEGGNVGPPALR